jgi:ABC-type iron transport system FetAB ATPase subunit
MNDSTFTDTLMSYVALKPDSLIIDNVHWKYLIRSVLKGKNILIVGPTGSGKCVSGDTEIEIKVSEDLYKKLKEIKNL